MCQKYEFAITWCWGDWMRQELFIQIQCSGAIDDWEDETSDVNVYSKWPELEESCNEK